MGKKRHKSAANGTNVCMLKSKPALNQDLNRFNLSKEQDNKSCDMIASKSSRSKIDNPQRCNEKTKSIVVFIEKKQVLRFILSLITCVIYANSLNCGFVYDDRRAILENRDVFSSSRQDFDFSSWLQIFKDDFWGTPIGHKGSHKSYRPLVTLTFKIQALIAQQFQFNHYETPTTTSAFSFHLVNLLLHLLVVDLVFRIANECFSTSRGLMSKSFKRVEDDDNNLNPVACIASLLFACHPIHVEAVTSLVGRAELMGTLFALLSFHSLAKHLIEINSKNHTVNSNSTQITSIVKSSLYAILACLSKENSSTVIIINLILIIWATLKNRKSRKSTTIPTEEAKCFIIMSILLCAFIAFRMKLNSSDESSQQPKWLPKFSSLDNPLAQNPKQFCLRHPEATFLKINFTSTTTKLEELEAYCSSEVTIKRIESRFQATRLYLPLFNLKLLLYPNELSYDWPLESIGLVRGWSDWRFMLSMLLYLSLGVFASKWLGALLKLNDVWSRLMEAAGATQLITNNKRAYIAAEAAATEVMRTEQPLPVELLSVDGDSKYVEEEEESDDEGNGSDETSSVKSVDTIKSSDSGFVDSSVNSNSSSSNVPFNCCQVRRSHESGKRKKKKVVERATSIMNEQVSNSREELCSCSIAWSLIWLILPYLPASNLLLPVGFLVAERTLYLPSFGFCLLIANLLNHLVNNIRFTSEKQSNEISFGANNKNKTLEDCCAVKFKVTNNSGNMATKLALIFPLLILFSIKTVDRNNDWKNELSLYSSNLLQSPAKSMANLASLMAPSTSGTLDFQDEKADFALNEKVEKIYRAALEKEPESADLHYNFALALHGRARNGGKAKSHENKEDPVEYHYKLALKLRRNFPLAALNLGVYQYEKLNQLARAQQTFEQCAFNMDSKETRTFRQHVQIQIECLISGAKVGLVDSSSYAVANNKPVEWQQTNGATKQTMPDVGATSSFKQRMDDDTIRQNGCLKIVEWMKLAKNRAKQIEWIDGEQQFGDLNKQMATIHWILAQCESFQLTTSRGQKDQLIESSKGKLLHKAVEFAFKSQVSIEAKIYTSYVDFLLHSEKTTAMNLALKILHKALKVETAKRKLRHHLQLAKLHHKLAKILLKTAQNNKNNSNNNKKEALKQMDFAFRLAPNNLELVSDEAQMAYDLSELQLSEFLYSKVLELLVHDGDCNSFVVNKKVETEIQNRKLARARANFGAILQVNGKLAEAGRQYRKALDCDPNNMVAQTNLKRLEKS